MFKQAVLVLACEWIMTLEQEAMTATVAQVSRTEHVVAATVMTGVLMTGWVQPCDRAEEQQYEHCERRLVRVGTAVLGITES